MTGPLVIDRPERYLNAGIELPARWKLPKDGPFDQPDTLVLDAATLAAAKVPDLPGLHYVGPFDESTVNNVYWPHLRITQPEWCAVVGAGQIDQARNFAAGVQNDPIRTNVIFRHWRAVQGSESDNGRMSVLTAGEWIARVGWLYQDQNFWVMPDNEGFGPAYGETLAALIYLASAIGLKLAVGAWPSHNPPEDQWNAYRPLFEALYAHPEHVYVPHIYYSRSPSVVNMDGFKFVERQLSQVAKWMQAPPPFRTVISEFGRLVNKDGKALQADEGFNLEISGTDYADEVVTFDRMWPAWPKIVFSEGAWGTRGSLGVNQEYRGRMGKYATGAISMPDVEVQFTYPETVTPPDGPEVVVSLPHGGGYVNIREDASTNKEPIGRLLDGQTVIVKLPTVTGQDLGPLPDGTERGDQWYSIYVPALAKQGYVHSYYVSIPDAEPTPEPEPEPDPTPPVVTPPDGDGTPTLSDADWARIDARFDAIMARLDDYDRLIGIILELLSGLQAGENSRSQAITLSIQEALTQWHTVQTEEVA